jgi:hypothetical protein
MPHPGTGLYYWDTLVAVLGDAIRRTVDMQMKDWKPRSEWGKQFLADVKNEARAEGRIGALLEVLDARGLALAPPLRQRVAGCTDLDVLAQWLRRAATATSAEEVFAS